MPTTPQIKFHFHPQIFPPSHSFNSPHPDEKSERKSGNRRRSWMNLQTRKISRIFSIFGENISQWEQEKHEIYACAVVRVCAWGGKNNDFSFLSFGNPNHDEGACYNAFSPDPFRKIRNFLPFFLGIENIFFLWAGCGGNQPPPLSLSLLSSRFFGVNELLFVISVILCFFFGSIFYHLRTCSLILFLGPGTSICQRQLFSFGCKCEL